MHPFVRRDRLHLGQLDHVDRRRVAALPAAPAFERGLELSTVGYPAAGEWHPGEDSLSSKIRNEKSANRGGPFHLVTLFVDLFRSVWRQPFSVYPKGDSARR
jgi:hypothetical protein